MLSWSLSQDNKLRSCLDHALVAIKPPTKTLNTLFSGTWMHHMASVSELINMVTLFLLQVNCVLVRQTGRQREFLFISFYIKAYKHVDFTKPFEKAQTMYFWDGYLLRQNVTLVCFMSNL